MRFKEKCFEKHVWSATSGGDLLHNIPRRFSEGSIAGVGPAVSDGFGARHGALRCLQPLRPGEDGLDGGGRSRVLSRSDRIVGGQAEPDRWGEEQYLR